MKIKQVVILKPRHFDGMSCRACATWKPGYRQESCSESPGQGLPGQVILCALWTADFAIAHDSCVEIGRLSPDKC